MSDERVTVGEEVITSGGDRIFPKGLPVGKVASVEPGKDLFLNIRVVPSSRLDRLEEVLVVTKMVEKPPDTKDLGPIRAADILAERLPTVPNQTPTDAAGNVANPASTSNAAGTNARGITTNPTAAQPATKPKIPVTATTTGGLPTTNVPMTNGALKPTTPGTSTAAGGRPATTTAKTPAINSGSSATATQKPPSATAPGTESAGNPVDATSTVPPQRPVKKVIVEADPEPVQKPVRKNPQVGAADAPPANTTPPQTEGTNPQR
jgi:rod shape-determining protein MreC